MELLESADKLASRSAAQHTADSASYVRLLSSRDFDTQKLASKINSLQHLSKSSYTRAKLEGSNVEGYIFHHQDMIVLDAVYKAKTRADHDIEHSQRTDWTWRHLMGSKWGGGVVGDGALGSGGDQTVSAAAYNQPRILPIVAMPKSQGAAAQDDQTMVYLEEEGEGDEADFTAELIERWSRQACAAAGSTPIAQPLHPFSALRNEILRGRSPAHLDAGASQCLFTLDLLASMMGETADRSPHYAAYPAVCGGLVGLGYTTSDSPSPSSSSSLSSSLSDAAAIRSRLADGALAHFQAIYLDAGCDDSHTTATAAAAAREDMPSWRVVYKHLRRGKLSAALSFLEQQFGHHRWDQNTRYARDDSQVAEKTRVVLRHLVELEQRSAQGLQQQNALEESGGARSEELYRTCEFFAKFLLDDSRGGRDWSYLKAVLSLLSALWDPQDEEACASEMPGDCDSPVAGGSDCPPPPDLESFLWAKLWLTKFKRLLRKDEALALAKRGFAPDQAPEAPEGEMLLYMALRENGGPEGFAGFASPHCYVRALLCCHRFGEAIEYLVAQPGHEEEAVLLCCACLYYGLLASHVPLVNNPLAVSGVVESDGGMEGWSPASLLLAHVQSRLSIPGAQHSLPALRAAVHCLALLPPPAAVQREVDRETEELRSMPAALRIGDWRRRRIEALSDMGSKAHAAFGDALEDVLVGLSTRAAEYLAVGRGSYLLQAYPKCPVEVLLCRVGARALATNHDVEKAIFFYQSAERLPQLCQEAAHALALAVMPASSQAGADRLQREWWYAAAGRIVSLLERADADNATTLPSSLAHETRLLRNLRAVKDAADRHYRGDEPSSVFEALDRLDLGGRAPGSGAQDRVAVDHFFAQLSPEAILLYNQYTSQVRG